MKRDPLPLAAGLAIAAAIPAQAWRMALAALAAALVWIGVSYAATAAAMVGIWARSETFAHGFVVAPISLWLIWRMRNRLAALSPRPSWIVLPFLAAAGFGWLLGEFGAVNALSQAAFVAMLIHTSAAASAASAMRHAFTMAAAMASRTAAASGSGSRFIVERGPACARYRGTRDRFHRLMRAAAHPRFRVSKGPSALTTGRGSFRHRAINARYLGLSGLFCGTSRAQQLILIMKRRRREPQFFLKSNDPVPCLLRP